MARAISPIQLWTALGSRGDAWERARYASRSLAVFPDDDGMYVLKGRLPAEIGALLMRAVEAASDALYREGSAAQQALAGEEVTRAAAARWRADALGLLAERALAAGFGGGTVSPPVPTSGSRAERYQVVLHLEAATLEAEGEPGRSEFEDGTRVPAETSRRLGCDAAVVRVTHPAVIHPAPLANAAPTRHDGRWQPPPLDTGPVERLIRDNRSAANAANSANAATSWIEPDGWTAGARWEREDDIPTEILSDGFEAAAEAMPDPT